MPTTALTEKLSSWVSVPLRGKEGAGPYCSTIESFDEWLVSVPLRGKEGAGLSDEDQALLEGIMVSVPLRGKEGAGPLVFGNLI